MIVFVGPRSEANSCKEEEHTNERKLEKRKTIDPRFESMPTMRNENKGRNQYYVANLALLSGIVRKDKPFLLQQLLSFANGFNDSKGGQQQKKRKKTLSVSWWGRVRKSNGT
jgi:hypothetical protein